MFEFDFVRLSEVCIPNGILHRLSRNGDPFLSLSFGGSELNDFACRSLSGLVGGKTDSNVLIRE
jgi:hypothetical protein